MLKTREHEEFRLRLENDRAIALKQIDARVAMAEHQSKVMSEAMGNADIKIVGGDGQFFDRFVKAVSLGNAIDGVLDNSDVVKTLARFRPATFTVTVDDEVIEGPHMLVVVGNSTRYGGVMKVTPDASLVDGELDVCLLGAMSTGAFLRAFPSVFRGAHVKHPAVRMLRGRRIAIEADRRVLVYADGERVGPAPVTLEVVPEALSVVVGPNPPAILTLLCWIWASAVEEASELAA